MDVDGPFQSKLSESSGLIHNGGLLPFDGVLVLVHGYALQ